MVMCYENKKIPDEQLCSIFSTDNFRKTGSPSAGAIDVTGAKEVSHKTSFGERAVYYHFKSATCAHMYSDREGLNWLKCKEGAGVPKFPV